MQLLINIDEVHSLTIKRLFEIIQYQKRITIYKIEPTKVVVCFYFRAWIKNVSNHKILSVVVDIDGDAEGWIQDICYDHISSYSKMIAKVILIYAYFC